ncbi:thioesterase family protein [Myxococcus sp. CA040A]|uniref:thioesterase family protein n=1 Tax=Myxococcus sp. CA040A TaxID=2741738 RepID=UPI00157A7147|nr:thioesterase family protein [Myxococcus sp. CA040A]NTX08644.1 thioesterase family protein [Myxococcus sp. CA040A]
MTGPRAYFVRTEDGGFLPQRACAGAWNPEELHISPVNGLLLHELERWLAGRKTGGKLVTRISYDYLGVLDFSRCDVAFEVLRPGRAVDLVEGVLSQRGRPVLRARVWLLATHDTSAIAGGAREALPPPEEGRRFDLNTVWPGDYVASVDMRAIEGPSPGRTTAWLTTPLAIVDGDPVSDLARCALLVDTSNGIAVRRRPEEWQFPNVDLTIHLFRQPVGAWTGFDTRVTFGPTGHGLTSSDLFDMHGHIGRAEQTLLVRPR